ncbi:MAG: M23 family metallopeptidase [Brevinema sp.]
MKIKKMIFGILCLYPITVSGNVLVISPNTFGKLPNINWNGSTPLAVDSKYNLSLTASINGSEIPFTRRLETNFEQIQYTFTPERPLTNKKTFTIHVKNNSDHKNWFNSSYKIKVTKKIQTPLLKIVSISKTITHGGSGLVIVKSELAKNLQFLGVVDEKNVVFYPKTFVKDGYYVILFPWYSDYSGNFSNQYILAIDHSGNINRLSLNSTPKLRDYVKKRINLPANYAQEKAKELSLSKEQAKKLEGNIQEINKALSVKSVSRWNLTRIENFKKSVKEVVSSNIFFSDPAEPFPNAFTTASYGDQRTYYYKKNIVRTSIHRGLDLAFKKNSPVYALMDGVVVYADWNSGNGKSIYIDHGLGVYSMYAHNEVLLVKEKQKVHAGEQISISGTTGQSTGDHLHISIIVQGMYVEPKEWLTKNSIEKLFHDPIKEALNYMRVANK